MSQASDSKPDPMPLREVQQQPPPCPSKRISDWLLSLSPSDYETTLKKLSNHGGVGSNSRLRPSPD